MLNVSVLQPPSTLPRHGILGSCSRFLKSHDGAGLETHVSLEVLSDLTDQTLEWQFSDQKLSGLLVTTDLTESNGTGTIPMGFLDSTGGWGRFAGSLGCQLFAGGFASGRLTSCLLGTGHFENDVDSVSFASFYTESSERAHTFSHLQFDRIFGVVGSSVWSGGLWSFLLGGTKLAQFRSKN